MEAGRVIQREVFPEVPPPVKYELTAFGHPLEPVLLMSRDWGATHIDALRPAEPTAPAA